jgi:hypothetical protein
LSRQRTYTALYIPYALKGYKQIKKRYYEAINKESDVKDVIFALFAGLLGLALCFGGYRLARILIPLWGLLAGFTLGAAGVSDALNNSFIGTTMGIIVGVIVGLVFALLAYFFFSLAVILFTASLGYWIGTSFVLFLGFDKGFLSAVIGIVIGAIFGFFALFGNLTKYYLIVLTAIGGAVVVLGGVMLLFNKIQLDAFNYAAVSQTVSNSWLALSLAAVLAVVGLAFQLKSNPNYTLEEWGTMSTPKKVASKVE